MHRYIHCNQSPCFYLQMTRPEHIDNLLVTLRVRSENNDFDRIAIDTLDKIIVLLAIYPDELHIDERYFSTVAEAHGSCIIISAYNQTLSTRTIAMPSIAVISSVDARCTRPVVFSIR